MNAVIWVNGENVTEGALLEQTRINTDSTRHITTASISLLGDRPGESATWGEAVWGESFWALDIEELYFVTILDGRDLSTKLFEGQIFALDLKQTDADPPTQYVADLNDYSSWLDRAVCWDPTFPVAFPISDANLIKALLGRFCPQIKTDLYVQSLLPSIRAFDWKGKTCRQVLDEVSALSLAEWRVDYSANLRYNAAGAAPPAPYELSTSPDFVTSFPVRVDSWKRDFTNPINRAFVRGGYIPGTSVIASAEYRDPVSIDRYGEFSYAVVDDSVTDPLDAELKAKTTVLKYAYPIEQGSFTVWRDGLEVGMRVRITEEALGIDGEYVIRSLSYEWKDQWTVEYKANFGSAQPDLESYLRLLEQRSRWKTSNPTTGYPLPGSVTDDSIASSGLHSQSIKSVDGGVLAIGSVAADKIGSVNGGTILAGSIQSGSIGSVSGSSVIAGSITSDKIGSVNGGTIIAGSIDSTRIGSVNGQSIIVGSIDSSRIGSVNGQTINVGTIDHTKIGSINAASITVGVIVSEQVANGLVDDLAKFAEALRPVQIVRTGTPWPPAMPNDNYPPNAYFFYEANGHFYRVTPDGLTWTDQGTDPDALSGRMAFYSIGRLSAKNITGLILAGQIDTIRADQIFGAIQANQIASITAGQITGPIQSTQIGSIDASTITSGYISAARINSVAGSAIQAGTISADKIGSVSGSTIQAGTISADKIASVNGGTITAGSITAGQIASINGAVINVGSVGDSQIGSVSGGKITANSITSDKLSSVEILVGGGGNRPGKFTVTNSVGGAIGYVGNLDGSNFGGWFSVFGAGGSGYSTAKVYTNSSGSLFVKDANLSITGSGSTISTSPTEYDATYASLAVKVVSGSDETKLISRGMVVTYGSKVGFVGRGPGGYFELECSTGTYVHLSGQTGKVRADGGFQCGGLQGSGSHSSNAVITYAKPGGGSGTINIAGGIIVSYS